jgi:hypothetical protein
LWVAPTADQSDALEVRALKRRGPTLSQALRLTARPARLARLLAASQMHVAPTLVATRTALPPEGARFTLGRPGGETGSGDALDRTAACA